MSDLPVGWDRSFCEKYKIYPRLGQHEVNGLYLSLDSDLSVVSFLKFREKKDLALIYLQQQEFAKRASELFGSEINKKNHKSFSPSEIGQDKSIIRLLDEIIGKGISVGASDIHFEPFEKNMDCRYRIDGVLRKDRNISGESVSEVIARIKIMSGLDISEKRRPQDGRIRFKAENRTVDIRVSILPTDFGEKAVLRILDKETLRLDLNLLGLSNLQHELLEGKIKLPNGMILVTGPTGSGKTTTLYAVLNRLRSPNVNITTIEDPIEYNLEGINQTQIKPEIDVTFANALRAILRQDPDIIMVGEIRDKETLDQAIRASLTGHLLLSTLHTNDAIATITRMIDLGAESYLLGSTLKLIIAQRLVQTICDHCKQPDSSPEQRAAALKLGIDSSAELFSGAGCTFCGNTGYVGRKAIYEMLPIDESLGNLISKGCTEADIRQYTQEHGYKRLKHAGIDLIKAGVTTPIEVFKAVAI
ncbi:MAG: GspE/PulE family protein [candidate division Zixibacteria bacterium]